MLGNVLHDADVETLQQGDATGKAFLEVYFATHGTLRNSTHLGTYAIALSQFVDTLCLDECRVHIEADESAHTSEHIVLLEREVYLHLLRQLHKLRLHFLTIDGFAT